ncbi:hypothetical protein MYA_1387 [Burkholderia sp. KJ006]|nr:hypothetical protein MYA_1387 [Burkholderia sp. KJ006]
MSVRGGAGAALAVSTDAALHRPPAGHAALSFSMVAAARVARPHV